MAKVKFNHCCFGVVRAARVFDRVGRETQRQLAGGEDGMGRRIRLGGGVSGALMVEGVRERGQQGGGNGVDECRCSLL